MTEKLYSITWSDTVYYTATAWAESEEEAIAIVQNGEYADIDQTGSSDNDDYEAWEEE
jgi:hypothetical protein